MDDSERARRGDGMRRQILGDAHVDRANATRTPLTADFQDLITRYAWGELWTRPGLDPTSRRLITLALMVALGRDDELRMHVRAALVEGGVSTDTLKEVLLHCALYCGLPAANQAFQSAQRVIDELAAPYATEQR